MRWRFIPNVSSELAILVGLPGGARRSLGYWMRTGVELSTLEPIPSCPYQLKPQP